MIKVDGATQLASDLVRVRCSRIMTMRFDEHRRENILPTRENATKNTREKGNEKGKEENRKTEENRK